MNNLPPYKPGEKCPKCGHDDVAVLFCSADEVCGIDSLLDVDHLDRHCKRCGYEWAEECMDTAED